MITPKDHISHDLSYFSGPKTSGARDISKKKQHKFALTYRVLSYIYTTYTNRTQSLLRGSSHDKCDIHLTDLHNTACSKASVMGYAVKSL